MAEPLGRSVFTGNVYMLPLKPNLNQIEASSSSCPSCEQHQGSVAGLRWGFHKLIYEKLIKLNTLMTQTFLECPPSKLRAAKSSSSSPWERGEITIWEWTFWELLSLPGMSLSPDKERSFRL